MFPLGVLFQNEIWLIRIAGRGGRDPTKRGRWKYKKISLFVGVQINGIGCLVLPSPPPSSNEVVPSTKIVASYVYSEVTTVTGSAISPKLWIKCFLTILFLIFSVRTKNKESITLIHKKEIIWDTILSIVIYTPFSELIPQILLNFDIHFKESFTAS